MAELDANLAHLEKLAPDMPRVYWMLLLCWDKLWLDWSFLILCNWYAGSWIWNEAHRLDQIQIHYLAGNRCEFLNFIKCKCSDLFPYMQMEVEFVTFKKCVFVLRTILTRRLQCVVNYLMMVWLTCQMSCETDSLFAISQSPPSQWLSWSYGQSSSVLRLQVFHNFFTTTQLYVGLIVHVF